MTAVLDATLLAAGVTSGRACSGAGTSSRPRATPYVGGIRPQRVSIPSSVSARSAGARALSRTSRTVSSSGRQPTLVQAVAAPDAVMLRSYKSSELSPEELQKLLERPRIDFSTILGTVQPIVDAVRERGDEAVKEYTSRFDRVDLDSIIVKVEDLEDPVLDPASKAAFDVAYDNIAAFHEAQKQLKPLEVETMPGVTCRRVPRPIGAVGLYVPGGTAVLPSTTLMLAVPAKIAGCKTIVVATPPRSDGSICPEVLYVAKKAGATHVLKAGGAQAVAAMSWGTETCPKVDKIMGPGNQFVTAAKMLLQNSEAMISIDMPAGPSEVLVIADEEAPPAFVAADLLSQAEHGPDSQVVLLALPGVDMAAVEAEVQKQCDALPRSEIALQALGHSCSIVVRDMAEAVAISNQYAPEHLIVNTKDGEDWLDQMDNAGSIFMGKWTPESVGDYASGTNHVLPTYGYSRMYSGVNLDTFVKYMTVQSLTEDGLKLLGPHVAHMAAVEGLDAHKRAVTLRLGMDP